MTDTLLYLIMGTIFFLCISLYIMFKRRYALKILKQNITMRWGKSPKDQYGNEELKAISGYYNNNLTNDKNASHYIDDITWNDLDMDGVFKRINNTQSTVGEEFLYYLLRSPVFDESILKERNKLIEYFRVNLVEREKLQMTLAGLGKKRLARIYDYFFNNFNISIKYGRYVLLSITLLVSPASIIFNTTIGCLFVVAMYLTNILIYYKMKNEKEVYLESLRYIIELIRCSKDIVHADISGIYKYTKRLKDSSECIRSLSINSFYQFFYQTNDYMFLEPIKSMFLVELIAFERLKKTLNKYNGEIRTLYETVGFLDSMISIASYRELLNFYAVPEMYHNSASSPMSLLFKDAYHPLIDNPVTNSINVEKSVLVTGSNASGKSTFLKMIAINAIFAQTIHTCLAREYKSTYFMIFTSMALRDDISNNESYYISEIKSLKRILISVNDAFPLLCIIDEVLRGTNTIERIAASSEVLYSLSKSNCKCIAATHDIELASILDYQYDNYHFHESFEKNNILFDYKIYHGKSITCNAIKLLRIMGYADEIVDVAEAKAERFLKEGRWCLNAD